MKVISLPRNQSQPGMNARNGKSGFQPPNQSVVATPETTNMLAYSPMKNMANFMDEYSVWNPAINSDSASGRSNGARFVSATIAMRYIQAARKPGKTQNLTLNMFQVKIPPDCDCTTSARLSEPD